TTLWVDAAQLEEGKTPTQWQARYPAELALEAATDGAIFFPDQVPVLNIHVGGQVPEGARIVGEVESLLGGKDEMPVASADARKWEPVLPGGRKLGMFKVRASIIDADGKALSA